MKSYLGTLRIAGYFAVAIVILVSYGLATTAKGRREDGLMQNARDIGLMLFHYSQDHGGRYPEGATSTEVFQKLVDGNYVFDDDGFKAETSIFYARMPGKTPATSRQLKPENVSWDVTVPIDEASPHLPVVFLTGYRLVYKRGGEAVPLAWPERSWGDWLTNTDYPRGFIVVNYTSNDSFVLESESNGPIPKVVPEDFVKGSVTYRQLTPNGSLP